MIPAARIKLSARAAESLDTLESSSDPNSKAIAKRIHVLKPLLLADCLRGEVVRKSAIPTTLRAGYGIENLYVEDLPGFWRLLYTIVKIDGDRIIVVIEIVDHRAYDKWFPGRKR